MFIFDTIKEISNELNKIIWNTCAVKMTIMPLPIAQKEKEELKKRLWDIEDSIAMIIKEQSNLTATLDSFYNVQTKKGE